MSSKKTKKKATNGNGHKARAPLGVSSVPIDKGIPVPSKNRWPFGSLEVGDSFAAPDTSRSAVASAMYQYKKRHGGAFLLRKTESGEYRVWRTA